MARQGIMGCMEKRDLLNQSSASVATLLRLAKEYEAAGRVHEAVDFYEKAGDPAPLEALLPGAHEDGDAFLLGRIYKVLGKDPAPEEWLRLAERAEQLGKPSFAREALRRAGREDAAATGETASPGTAEISPA